MFGLTTRGQLDPVTQLEFERLYARLNQFISVSFDEDGALIQIPDTSRVVGEVIDYAGPTAPDKWLICDGSQVSRVTFKSLYEIIGTTYGAGDGSTTFNIPDARQRFTLGKTAVGVGAVLGEVGGDIDHSHTFTGLSISGTTSTSGDHNHSASGSADAAGNHSHGMSALANGSTATSTAGGAGVTAGSDFSASVAGHAHFTVNPGSGAPNTDSDGSHSHSVSVSVGNDGSHSHTFSGSSGAGSTSTANPPYITFNKIIYTGVSE